ncbi:hypothetical protein AURDEDRAFT_179183 [Auricularia subglabra TFB-10046 SS5]|nr:hypothetical protein AURDEDRAFT_179183 [Auricularia subglabra TFB-10046 SS5]
MSDERSPSATPQAASTKHIYSSSRSGTCALTLQLLSFAASPQATPLFPDGAAIRGQVTVELGKRSKISSVVLSIRGFERGKPPTGLTSANQSSNVQDHTFMEQSVTLWSAATSSNAALDAGAHHFSFRETLPQTVLVSGRHILLPSSFAPDNSPIFVLYEISVVVNRGFLHRDESVLAPIRFVRRSQAESPARQVATDPLAWSNNALTCQGRFHDQRPVEFHLQLCVPSPAQFPRGYPIPIWITIRSHDRQALDMLAAAGSLIILLERVLTWNPDISHSPIRDEVAVIARGRLWPPAQGSDPTTRKLQGEVLPPNNLPPSLIAPNFQVNYSVSCAVQVNGFHAMGSRRGEQTAVSLPVTITSLPAPGPRPARSNAPSQH